MSNVPSIGRIVHQQHPVHGCLAGVIVQLCGSDSATGADEVTIDRFDHPDTPGGLLYRVREGEPGEAGTWHWPERV